MEKKRYSTPVVNRVSLDTEISILMSSTIDLGDGGAGDQGGTEDQEPYNPFINPLKWFR